MIDDNDKENVTDEMREIMNAYFDPFALGQMVWGRVGHPLLEGCLLQGDETHTTNRGYAVRGALQWALERLSKSGSQYARQSFEILHYRYIEERGMSVAKCAKKLGREEATIKHGQKKALIRLGELLSQESIQRQAVAERRKWGLYFRYEGCSAESQRLLRFFAIFRLYIPQRIALVVETIAFQPHLSYLLEANLIVQDQSGRIRIHPEMMPFVQERLVSAETAPDHAAALKFYQLQNNKVESLYHLQQLGSHQQAAELLLADALSFNNSELSDLLNRFVEKRLSADTWKKLKLLAGNVAYEQQKLDAALREYEQVLGSSDTALNAEAFYHIAQIYELRDIDEALRHYQNAFALLDKSKKTREIRLLIEVLIKQAWIFLDQRLDLTSAEQKLCQVERLLQDEWVELRSDLHNSWGEYYMFQGDLQKCGEHRWKAWLFAREAQDINRAIQTGYNLASLYIDEEKYDEAERRLLECMALAFEVGNQRMQALSSKQLGWCYVLKSADYLKAINYYQTAYDYFVQANNRYWQAAVCYDFAETYLLLGDVELAQHYFAEAKEIAAELEASRLQEALEELAEKYIELSEKTDDRQRKIITYVRQNGSITKKDCTELIQTSERTAARELNDFVDSGILVRQGEGRGTHYLLASKERRF